MENFTKSFFKDEVKSWLKANGYSTATIKGYQVSSTRSSLHEFAFATELELKPSLCYPPVQ